MVLLNILWPTFAMVALIFVVWITMFVHRIGHMKRNPPDAASFASGESAKRYFQPVEMAANNFTNLFEMPVLFFALVPLLVIASHANHVQVVLAWLFVLFRAIHSYIHIVTKKVPPRFMAYLASTAVLSAMWIGFFIDMVSAAHTYSEAMARMGAN